MLRRDRAVVDLAIDRFKTEGALTISQLLTTLPELAADSNGADILRLLLRLDCRLCLLADGRWTLAAVSETPERRILASAKAYLDALPSSGAMLTSVVAHIVRETDYDQATVDSAIRQSFVVRGRVVLNRPKETI